MAQVFLGFTASCGPGSREPSPPAVVSAIRLRSLATFDKVQERRNGVAKLPMRKDIGEEFTLRGFVCCAGCSVPLRSSWAKGRTKSYPYYLCQTKSCDHYGKSIARDKIEQEVGDIVKTLQPAHNVVALVKLMVRHVWDARLEQTKTLKASLTKHIHEADRQIEKIMDRLLATTNDAMIHRYETKINGLERDKARYTDQITHLDAPKTDTYQAALEPALKIVTNPWKLWEISDIALRRLILKLAFAERLNYDRNTGPRTAKISIPFRALEGDLTRELQFGARRRTRTTDTRIFSPLLYQLSYPGALRGAHPRQNARGL